MIISNKSTSVKRSVDFETIPRENCSEHRGLRLHIARHSQQYFSVINVYMKAIKRTVALGKI